MGYFVDPYKNYYEKLSASTDVVSQCEQISSKMANVNSDMSSLESSLSSSGWKELGIETLSQKTIPGLISNIQVLQDNIDTLLKGAATKAINELLPLLTEFKTSDEQLDKIVSDLGSLEAPQQYRDGETTPEYREYLDKRRLLEIEEEKLEKSCKDLKKECNDVVTAIKALDGSFTEFSTAEGSSQSPSENVPIWERTPATSQGLDSAIGSGNLLSASYQGTPFYIVNTRIRLDEYEDYVQSNGLYQRYLLGGRCDLLSKYYAMDMISGRPTSGETMADHGGAPAVQINNGYSSVNEQDVLRFVYGELQNGRPTVLQVSWSGPGRHLVTVVGVDASVQSYEDLTPDKILVLDCADGRVQRLSDRGRRLLSQNGGYAAWGATAGFLQKVGA